MSAEKENTVQSNSEKELDPVAERINKFLEYRGLKRGEFADSIQVSRATITHILNGRNKPTLDVVKKICEKYPELNLEWLLLGVGNMLKNNGKSKKQSLENNQQESEHLNEDVNKMEQKESTINNTLKEKTDKKEIKTESSSSVEVKVIKQVSTEEEKSEARNTNVDSAKNDNCKSDDNNGHGKDISMGQLLFDPNDPERIIVLFPDRTFVTYQRRKD